MNKITLICLPYAGGNRYSYRMFENLISSHIEMISMDYPGRGMRAKESLERDIHSLADNLKESIVQVVGDRKYAIFGHSLGGLLAWIITTKLIQENRRLPIHLFISGTKGPSARQDDEKKHLLDKASFIEEVRKLKGSPDEVFLDKELVEYFEPILRADFEVSENYVYKGGAPIDIPITVITGNEEEITTEEVGCWEKEFSANVEFLQLPGDHFFLFKDPAALTNIIQKKLLSI